MARVLRPCNINLRSARRWPRIRPSLPARSCASISMKRREFLAFLAGATVFGPRASFAQPSTKVYHLGTLGPGAPFNDKSPFGSILVRVLADHGYTLGQNLAFESYGAMGQVSKLP